MKINYKFSKQLEQDKLNTHAYKVQKVNMHTIGTFIVHYIVVSSTVITRKWYEY